MLATIGRPLPSPQNYLATSLPSMNRQVKCQLYGCCNLGSKYCGACRESCYCSSKCQRGDWKLHKTWCNTMPTKLIPASEVHDIRLKINGILTKQCDDGSFLKRGPLLEKFLSFLEFQYGTKVAGKSYWIRDDVRADDLPLLSIHLALGDLYIRSLEFEKALFHTLEAREMSKIRSEVDDVAFLYVAENLLVQIYIYTSEHCNAQYHGQQALTIAREFSDDSVLRKTSYLNLALRGLADVRCAQDLHGEALVLSKEAYELVSGVHGPEHPDVQDAAVELIKHLMNSGNFSQADDFARVNYETLMGGSDPESYASSKAMLQLALIWAEKPFDPTEGPELGEEAEQLAKRAHKIAVRRSGHDLRNADSYLIAICDVSMKRCQLTTETRKNLEFILRNNLDDNRAVSIVTHRVLGLLGEFYIKLRPFNGNLEFEIGTMLVRWSAHIKVLLSRTGKSVMRNAVLQKAGKLFEEFLTEFLDCGLSSAMCDRSREAMCEYDKIMKSLTA